MVWLVVSAPIVYLIHRFVEPTYEAFSTLRVSPGSVAVFTPTPLHDLKIVSYLQTQVALITSDRVLGAAIANPEVANLSTIRESDDPRTDLRKNMTVEIMKDASLIRVALELADGNQAAAIVNAVVHSYLVYNGEHTRSANSTLRQSLASQQEKYKDAITEKRNELKTLVDKGNFTIPPTVPNLGKNDDDGGAQPVIGSISESQYNMLAQKAINTQLEIMKAESELKTKEAEATRAASETDQGQLSKLSEERREQQILDEFQRDPEVVALSDDIAAAAEQRERARKVARLANDPSRRMAEERFKKLNEQYNGAVGIQIPPDQRAAEIHGQYWSPRSRNCRSA